MNLAKLGLSLDQNGKIVRPNFDTAHEILESLASVPGTEANLSSLALPGQLSMYSQRDFASSSSSLNRFQSKWYERMRKEHPIAYRLRIKKALGLLDLDDDILTMDLKTLRQYFGYKNGRIKSGLFCRNIIWQVYRFSQLGKPPQFVEKGGNVRSLWYYVKRLTTKHSRSFGKSTTFDDLFSTALTEMTNAGLFSYRDFNFIDQNKANRWVSPSYGATNIILMAEKRSFSEELIRLAKQYGVTAQAVGGVSSRVTVETMLTEMADAGHDLTKPFLVFAMVDFDPAGWNIAQSFVEQMLDLGLAKIRGFWPYGRDYPRQPWIDMVSIRDLDTEFIKERRHKISKKQKSADEWITATGGLYGRSGKKWGLSSEIFLGLAGEHLAKKLPKYLPEDHERYQKIVAYESLDRPLKNYIAARLFADS